MYNDFAKNKCEQKYYSDLSYAIFLFTEIPNVFFLISRKKIFLNRAVENFSSLFCFFLFLFFFYIFFIWTFSDWTAENFSSLFCFCFCFLFFYIIPYLARDSCKKWQENIDKLGLISQSKQCCNDFLSTKTRYLIEKRKQLFFQSKIRNNWSIKAYVIRAFFEVYGAEKGFSGVCITGWRVNYIL